MEGYDAATYGDRFADVYDDWYGDDATTAATVAAVQAAAERSAAVDDGRRAPRVLELGAGTGRLALPLAAAGVEVVALDSSAAMLDRLAAKPGSDAVTRVVGDMVGPLPDGPFDVVLLARNTFFNLTTEADQRACAAAVAAVLAPSGSFALEAFVPDDDPTARRSTVEVRRIDADRVLLYVDRHDPDTGELWSSFVDITPDGVRMRPCHVRYLAPAPLDALLAGAGLRLDHRWAGWDGAAFDEAAAHHVSWYGRAA